MQRGFAPALAPPAPSRSVPRGARSGVNPGVYAGDVQPCLLHAEDGKVAAKGCY